MAAPSFVYTITCVAKMLGEPEDWLEQLASTNLEPTDGCQDHRRLGRPLRAVGLKNRFHGSWRRGAQRTDFGREAIS
jgi:hypothetical protein